MKKVIASFLILLVTASARAQKLPNKQLTSLRAPLNIKVDGKVADWGNQFQAYNHATDIFYSVANDDDNLYLVVQAIDPDIIDRIIDGGLTLVIQKGNRADKNENVSITYPIIDQKPYFNLRHRKNHIDDTSAIYADSLMKHNNDLLGKNCKFIRITGITGIDTMTSVYNTEGIKAAGAFNNRKAYTFELMINFKLIGVDIKSNLTFAYHIVVNGMKKGLVIKPLYITPGAEAFMNGFTARVNEQSDKLATPADFWGEYTLAKSYK